MTDYQDDLKWSEHPYDPVGDIKRLREELEAWEPPKPPRCSVCGRETLDCVLLTFQTNPPISVYLCGCSTIQELE